LALKITKWFRHSRRIDPIRRSTYGFCQGLWAGDDFFHSQRRDPQTNIGAVDAVPIPDQISGCIPIGERLGDLLSGPGGSRIFGDVEVQHLAAAMFQHAAAKVNPIRSERVIGLTRMFRPDRRA
jgi:hypothetical protein